MGKLIDFKIGVGNWRSTILEFGNTIRSDFWRDFAPVSAESLTACENTICRKLPEHFKEFLRTVGWGIFGGRRYGGFYSPDRIALECRGPLRFVIDVRALDAEEVRTFYITKGVKTPVRTVFEHGILYVDGVSVFNLIMIGWNGMECCHQLLDDHRKYNSGIA